VDKGELIHAALGREEGLDAAYRILSWEDSQVEFVFTCKVAPTIDLELTEILMNLALFKDAQAQAAKPRPDPFWQG
jgi:hypothetical protein